MIHVFRIQLNQDILNVWITERTEHMQSMKKIGLNVNIQKGYTMGYRLRLSWT